MWGDSSDDDDDLSLLFKGLSFQQIEKIDELVKSINDKDELLGSQEDLLIREDEKIVKLKNALNHEVENNKILTDELKVYNHSISCPKIENVDLIAKIKEFNVVHAATSSVEHVSHTR
jgi:hypothetical protein